MYARLFAILKINSTQHQLSCLSITTQRSVTKHLNYELRYVSSVKCETIDCKTKKCEFVHSILSKCIRKLGLLSRVLGL